MITEKLLKIVAPGASADLCAEWAPAMQRAAAAFGIVDKHDVAWWIANGLYECDQLRSLTEEISATCAKYDGGCDYRGRGLGHITHLYNYQLMQESSGYPVVAHPALMADAAVSSICWAIFWSKMGGTKMATEGRFEAISAAIHLGDPQKKPLKTTHHEIRQRFAERALRHLKA